MDEPKSWKSRQDQLSLLVERGMEVTDHDRAIEYLTRIGYYRLSGYWYPFRQRTRAPATQPNQRARGSRQADTIAIDTFKPGTTFQNVVSLYVFDKKLRLLTLDALERIEIAIRADIAHLLGEKDPFAYLKPELFHRTFSADIAGDTCVTKQHVWIGQHAKLIKRSKEEFVRHNKSKYGLPLTIWVACEVWDFGCMSTLFGGMQETDQKAISERYGISNGRIFASWLRSLNYLRNVCAHHSRLWNRNIVDQPKLPPISEHSWVAHFDADRHAQARCFLLLKIARQLLTVANPSSSWPERMKEHLLDFPDLAHVGLNLKGSGAPEGWQQWW